MSIVPPVVPDTSTVTEVTSTEQVDPKDRFDVFVRKEKQLLRQKRDIEARAQAMEAKYKDYDTTHIPRQRLIDDPLAVLSDLGIDYNKLSETILNNPNATDPTILALKKQLAAMEQKMATTGQPQTQNDSEARERALEHIRNQVKHVADSSTDYEVLRDSGAYERAVEIIEEHHNETGTLMDIKEACAKADKEIFDESVAYFSKIKRVQAHFAPKTPEPVKVEQGTRVVPRTLSNTLNTGSTTSGAKSESDRVAAAIALAQSMRKA